MESRRDNLPARAMLAPMLAAGIAALAMSSPAKADTIPLDQLISLDEADPADTIVVTRRPDPAPDHDEVRQQARSITRSGNIYNEPLALFSAKICPGVLGLPVDVAEMVVGRIRYNAERLGLALASPGECAPNLIVGFVGSGKADIRKMMDKSGSMLAKLPLAERRELLAETGPVHAWAVTTVRGFHGKMLEGQEANLVNPPVLRAEASHSLITMSTRLDIDQSVVLIDIATIDGMSVNQLADYATMRGIARTRAVSGQASYGTILNLFDPDAAHAPELTPFDIAYLKSLYANVPNIPGIAKVAAVKSALAREVALAGTGKEAQP